MAFDPKCYELAECFLPTNATEERKNAVAQEIQNCVEAATMTEPPFPTVEQWREDNPHEATPRCPGCNRYLGVKPAWMNASGREEWQCDGCDWNEVNEYGP